MPSLVVNSTETLAALPPLRLTVMLMLPAPSLTEYLFALRLTTPPLSTSLMVTVAVDGEPRVASLLGLLSMNGNVSEPVASGLDRRLTISFRVVCAPGNVIVPDGPVAIV